MVKTAEEPLREALAIQRCIGAPPHEISATLRALVDVLERLGCYGKASLAELRELREAEQAALGEDYAHDEAALGTLETLVIAMKQAHDWGEAEPLARELLAARLAKADSLLGKEAARAAAALLVNILSAMSKPEPELAPAELARTDVMSKPCDEAATGCESHGHLCGPDAAAGRLREAEALVREHTECSPWMLARWLCGLAELHARRDDRAAAERLYREAMDLWSSCGSSDRPAALKAREALNRILTGK